MFTILAILAWCTAMYGGFGHWPLYWIPALAVGVLVSEVIRDTTYNIIMADLRQQKLKGPTLMLLSYYLLSCMSVGATYGIGRLVSAAFS